jgi:hypothetical protein
VAVAVANALHSRCALLKGCLKVFHLGCAEVGRRQTVWHCMECVQLQSELAHKQSTAKAGAVTTAAAVAAAAAAVVESDTDLSLKTAKTGKKKMKKQVASAAAAATVAVTAAVHVADDSSAAAGIDDNEAVAPVCPSCNNSTASSKLDGTRQCEGQYQQQIVHVIIALSHSLCSQLE